MVTALTTAGVALVGAEILLMVWDEMYLSLFAGLLADASFVTAGIILHSVVVIVSSTAGIALLLLMIWWLNGRGKRRKRVSKELGDESRQLRDGLLRRLRDRQVTRREPAPLPS
jgi:hypothetical protein